MKYNNKTIVYVCDNVTFKTQKELARYLNITHMNVKRSFSYRGGVKKIIENGGSFQFNKKTISINLEE
jgi:hypothetical protein